MLSSYYYKNIYTIRVYITLKNLLSLVFTVCSLRFMRQLAHKRVNRNMHVLFTGGYYTIEQKGNKLRIIALNSNAFSTAEGRQNVDPEEQLEWLEKILNKSVKNKETVSDIV